MIVLLLGVTSGSIFANIIDLNDKNLVIEKIQTLLSNIDNNNINSLLVFKNSLFTNLTYSLIIYVMGLTVLGVLINIFILYIKGFIFGFSLASFIIVYGTKGIMLSIVYTFFGQVLNLIVIMILCIYSVMYISNVLKQIFNNKHSLNLLRFFKNYSIIFGFSLFITLISSLNETFLFPAIIKIIIKLFI